MKKHLTLQCRVTIQVPEGYEYDIRSALNQMHGERGFHGETFHTTSNQCPFPELKRILETQLELKPNPGSLCFLDEVMAELPPGFSGEITFQKAPIVNRQSSIANP
jgi:hypothetical protein